MAKNLLPQIARSWPPHGYVMWWYTQSNKWIEFWATGVIDPADLCMMEGDKLVTRVLNPNQGDLQRALRWLGK